MKGHLVRLESRGPLGISWTPGAPEGPQKETDHVEFLCDFI